MKNLGQRFWEESLKQKLILSKLPIFTIPSKSSVSQRKHPLAQSPIIKIKNYPQNSVAAYRRIFFDR